MTGQALRDAIHPQETDDDAIVLLAIEHSVLTDGPIRLSTAGGSLSADGSTYEIQALGQTWICAGLEIQPPGESDKAAQGRISIQNVDMRIGAALDAIATPATCTIWVVLASAPDEIVGGPHAWLRLIDVSGDAMRIDATLDRTRWTAEPATKDRITAGRFTAVRHWISP